MSGNRLLIWGAGCALTPLLAWLALPGRFSCWPLLLICLVPLLHLAAAAASTQKAFARGFVVGLPFYLLQIYWIVPVLMKYGGLPWFLAVGALLLLVCYMAFYLALFAAGFQILVVRNSALACIFGAASLWVGLDWLRSWLFSGFPWMDLGYGVWSLPRFTQAADLFGHYGYTWVVVLVNGLLALLIFRRRFRFQLVVGALAVAVVCLLIGGYSTIRWQQLEPVVASAEAPMIGIVQGNVEQDRKWSPGERERTVRDYLTASARLNSERMPELIVWPETALPFYPRDNELLQPIRDFVVASRQPLLTGAPWYEVVEEDGNRLIFYYNAALLLQPTGRTTTYYKTHLVPYGEYVPLQRYLPFLAPLVEAAGHFTPGHIDQPLTTGRIKAGVLICFESIFPELGRAWVEKGANILVNVTNDAWYGRSSAPHQSWAMTVFRAVETRRSLVRSANTGISGLVDPLGRVVRQSPLFVPWSAAMPTPLLEELTVFVRGGYLFAPLNGLIALVILALTVKKPQRTE